MRGIGRKQQRLRRLVVLGLREEIHRHPVGRRAAVRNDEDLGWAGHHVDADFAEHLALGLGHVDIAWADDLVDSRHRCGAVRERRDRLRAADRDDAVDAGEGGRGEHQRVGLRTDHHQLTHARNLGGDRVHQHRGRVRGLAAGHIEPDAIERRDALPEPGAIGFDVFPRLLQLPFMKCPDPRVRGPQRIELVCGNPDAWLDFQAGDGTRRDPVELPRVAEHRGVAASAHVGKDAPHGLLYRRVLRRLVARERGELRIEARHARREPAQLHCRAALPKASIRGCSAARLVFNAA